ncbi:MAG: hypothetical protein JNL82_08140 [Myxococcales bacterium]|nr:hypothetical protein [Myxococcales bacterium]
MTILKQLQTDMRKLQLDYQRELIVEALRNRAQELTLAPITSIRFAARSCFSAVVTVDGSSGSSRC